LRRAVVSVAANIAEGSGKGTDPDFIRFLRFSRGSAAEVESLVHVGTRLGYFSADLAASLKTRVDSVARLVLALQRGLRS
jgi:four helix bundle protein